MSQFRQGNAKGLYTILHTHDGFRHSPGLRLAQMIPHVLDHPGAQVHPVRVKSPH